jgi:hypothetical protein
MANMAEVLAPILQGLSGELEAYRQERDTLIKTQVRKDRRALAERIRTEVSRWGTELKMVKNLSKTHQLAYARRISGELEAFFQENRAFNDHETGKLATLLRDKRAEVEKLLQDEAAFSLQSAFAKHTVKKHAARSDAESQQKVQAAYQKLAQGGLFGRRGFTFERQSLNNLWALARALNGTASNPVMGLSVQERRLYDLLQSAPFFLTHATNQGNLGKILAKGSGSLLSNVQLLKKIPGLKTNTFDIDRELFSNDDFVFFTIDLKAKHAEDYGDKAFVLNADGMEFFTHGWLSYIDFLAPGPFGKAIRQKDLLPHSGSNTVVRERADMKEQDYKGDDYVAEYTFLYPPTKQRRKLALHQMVLYGPHIRSGLALSLLLELRLMKLTHHLTGLDDAQLADFVSTALNALYWLEAKLPADLYVRFMRPGAVPEQLSHSVWDKKFFSAG